MLNRLLPFDDAWERDVARASPQRVQIAAMIAAGCVAFWAYFELFALDERWAVEHALRGMGY